MIPRSFNRVSRPGLPRNLSTAISRNATSHPETPKHQRRPSSSKTSCPPGNERAAEAAANDTTKSSAGKQDVSEDSKKLPARLPRRKSKDGTNERTGMKARDEAFSNLPSVPSTSYLQVGDVHTSAFFSLHRPISITRPVPPSTSERDFTRIFESRPVSQHRVKDVIYTVSTPVPALDGDVQSREEKDLRWEILQNSSSDSEHHLSRQQDSRAQQQQAQPQSQPQLQKHLPQSLDELVKQFRPFNVPPAPVPFEDDIPQDHKTHPGEASSSESTAYSSSVASRQIRSPRQMRRALLVQRLMHARLAGMDANKPATMSSSVQATTSQVANAEADAELHTSRDSDTMHAISVKRQRKLKMKKHKYKKLMRRTRNLRRREGRN